jgi:predicted Zn finger-like uncharacterized protein
MPEITHCPNCQRTLRVPDELFGKLVKCPTCGTNFTATPATETVAAPVAEASPPPFGTGVSPPAYDHGYEPRLAGTREQALSGLRAPAICLLVTGILGLLCNLLSLGVKGGAAPDFPGADPKVQEIMRNAQEISNGPIGKAIAVGFVLVNFVVVFAGIAMLSGKMRWLAMTGSILAMININGCCCILGLPFGIWSIVALTRPGVAEAFQ